MYGPPPIKTLLGTDTNKATYTPAHFPLIQPKREHILKIIIPHVLLEKVKVFQPGDMNGASLDPDIPVLLAPRLSNIVEIIDVHVWTLKGTQQ